MWHCGYRWRGGGAAEICLGGGVKPISSRSVSELQPRNVFDRFLVLKIYLYNGKGEG